MVKIKTAGTGGSGRGLCGKVNEANPVLAAGSRREGGTLGWRLESDDLEG
jgi:hypothetical protein